MLGVRKKKGKKIERITFFNDKWEAVELIGQGSYGKVYKAKKEDFGVVTYCAIKQIEIPQTEAELHSLRTEGMTKEKIEKYLEKSVQKWVEEIKFMAIFKDSINIVNIEDYEIIKKEKTQGYIIHIRMELLKNLDDYILDNNVTDKEIIKMAIDVCSALEDCEKNNILHRDIKPDNIFVNKKNVYKVGDFGIAKHVQGTLSNLSKKGTENYMAPELYKNEKGNKTVDIYSLGIMLYRYFNYNRLPYLPDYPEEITFEDRENALAKRISGCKLKQPINASYEISKIILKACNYYPKDRYQSATELKNDLEAVYQSIRKAKVLFDFNDKKMNKIFKENTKNTNRDGTINIFSNTQDEKAKVVEKTIRLTNPIIEELIEEDVLSLEKEDDTNSIKTVEFPINNEILDINDKENKDKENNDLKVEIKKEVIKNSKDTKSKSLMKKILLVLIVIILLGAWFYPKGNKTTNNEMIKLVSMPSVIGKSSEDATKSLKKVGLEVEYVYQEVENEEESGNVISQSIKENKKVKEGTLVKLTITVSKEKITMISVVGLPIQEAKQKLEDMGLKTNVIEKYSDDVEEGKIISQMPIEGDKVNQDSTVELLVSLGKDKSKEEQVISTPKPTPSPSIIPSPTPTPTPIPTPSPIVINPTSIDLFNTTNFLAYQDTITLQAKVIPSDATFQKIVWSSSDSSVATVDNNGKVTPVSKNGKVSITATIESTSVSKSLEINIYLRGDINSDNLVDSADAAMALSISSYPSSYSKEEILRADMNQDGVVDKKDSSAILDYFLQN